MFYAKTTLPSGLRVITESIPYVRSASVGVWVGAGSSWETPQNMGISHLIEHMLFKGTPSRTARQIAQEIDGRGGNLNAYTAKEQTCYYAKVLDEHLPVAIDVLADMVLHSMFDPNHLAKEKGVVVEEIKMYEDVPDDLVHDLFAAAMWEGHALGRPIVGTEETVQSFTREQILGYCASHYIPSNIVIAAAGNVEHQQVVDLVARAFDELGQRSGSVPDWPAAPTDPQGPRSILRVKEHEQVHLVVGMKGLYQDHDDLYALHLLNTVLGGGASSRLFQEIREERALAYSVFSYQSSFQSTGNFAVYAGVSPKAVNEVLELILKEYRTMGENGLTAEELKAAKDQLKGEIMLGLESTSGRMTRLGRGELTRGRVLSPDEIVAKIDAVTLEGAAALAHRLFVAEPKVLAAVGPLDEAADFKAFGFPEVQHG
ncbi:MAG: M16 family metallopeptidase [Mycobacterium leprae]